MASTDWVLLVAVHANAASSPPRQIAATEAAISAGRRRSLGAGATRTAASARDGATPAVVAAPFGLSSSSSGSPCSWTGYWVSTCASPTVMRTELANCNGMDPLWPRPDHCTDQYDRAHTWYTPWRV
jgi:hypothetical protein